jgi:poly-gamma-glutamate synthesis protein (capsule biosynthesis protein)
LSEIEVFIGGDFYGGNRVENIINKKEYSFLFGSLINSIKSADISIVNLESPLFSHTLRPIDKTGPALKSNINVIDALEFAGFNLLTLANNHILDYGLEGLNSTIELIKTSKLDYVGVGESIIEARNIKYIEKKNKKIAVLNFCESEWSIATKSSGGAAPLDIIDNYKDIVEAKQNSDYALVIFHGGVENHNLPSSSLKKTLRFFVEAGADAIICHHTHSVSGYEIFHGKPIFYGIGNFVFDMENKRNGFWNIGMAIRLKLGTEVGFELLPFYQCNEKVGISELNDAQRNFFDESINKMNLIIQDELKLEDSLNSWSLKMDKYYDGLIQPYTNKYLKGLYKRGYIPTLFSRTNYLLLLNLIRCESHRKVLMNVLLNKINK